MPSTADLLRLHELDSDLGAAAGELIAAFKAAAGVTAAALDHLAELPESPESQALEVSTEFADQAIQRAWAHAVWALDALDAGEAGRIAAKRYQAGFRAELATAHRHCPSLALGAVRRAFSATAAAMRAFKRSLRACKVEDRLVYVGSTVVDVEVAVGHLRCRLPEELGKLIPFPVERARRAKARG